MAGDRTQFLQYCRNEMNGILRENESDEGRESTHQSILRLERLKLNISRAQGFLIAVEDAQELFPVLEEMLAIVKSQFTENADPSDQTGFQAPTETSSGGAPRYSIGKEQLEFLLSCGFNVKQMAEMMHVSTSTLKRRLRFYGLGIRSRYSTLSDESLDSSINEIRGENRLLGTNMIRASLRSRGVIVQRERIRQSVHRTDPGGVALRSSRALARRSYNVAGPNSLWHVDGNHKLGRWKLYIHGCVDGYSRLIIFMKASTDNLASTVLASFVQAVHEHGLPSRLRCDRGTENTEIVRYMVQQRGSNRGSAIQGRSVHNQRVERIWVDVWNGCINVFYDLFKFLEREGLCDINSDIHIYALHYVFLPRLKRRLQEFTQSWNNHSLRTEHSLTPLQLFVRGALQLQGSQHTAIEDLFHQNQAGEHADPAEEVSSSILSPLTFNEQRQLEERFPSLQDDSGDNLGVDLYVEVLNYITDMQAHD